MSHVALVQVECREIVDLKAACKSLGLEFMERQTTYEWFGRFVGDYHAKDAAYRQVDPNTFGTCNHAIRVPGASYEIGVIRRGDQWEITYDRWGTGGRGIERVLGTGLPKLKQAVAEAATKRVLRRQGYHVRRQVTADGRIVLTGVKG